MYNNYYIEIHLLVLDRVTSEYLRLLYGKDQQQYLAWLIDVMFFWMDSVYNVEELLFSKFLQEI